MDIRRILRRGTSYIMRLTISMWPCLIPKEEGVRHKVEWHEDGARNRNVSHLQVRVDWEERGKREALVRTRKKSE